ncbi:hypothetical protein NKDENANG_00962 [Candidatus Entotheonellaceae bacterium PAL068K]
MLHKRLSSASQLPYGYGATCGVAPTRIAGGWMQTSQVALRASRINGSWVWWHACRRDHPGSHSEGSSGWRHGTRSGQPGDPANRPLLRHCVYHLPRPVQGARALDQDAHSVDEGEADRENGQSAFEESAPQAYGLSDLSGSVCEGKGRCGYGQRELLLTFTTTFVRLGDISQLIEATQAQQGCTTVSSGSMTRGAAPLESHGVLFSARSATTEANPVTTRAVRP